jgi:hypothetical protein
MFVVCNVGNHNTLIIAAEIERRDEKSQADAPISSATTSSARGAVAGPSQVLARGFADETAS